MRNSFTLIGLVFITSFLMAQSPEKMSYQAVVRNTENAPIANQTVGMQISILQGSASGTPVYVEIHSPATNSQGLVSVSIGEGTVVTGSFTTIDWNNGPFFIKSETDPTGGESYTISGTSQLLSVPYALHAKTAENFLNDQVDDADADPTNEIDVTMQNGVLIGDGTEVSGLVGSASGQVLKWDGSAWSPGNDDTSEGSPVWNTTGDDAYFNAGNVGIGTDAPTNALHILADNPFPVKIESISGPDSGIEFANQFGTQGYMGNIGLGADMALGTVDGNTTGSLLFLTNNLVRMNLKPSGRLGLGVINPESKLDVFASPADTDLREGISLYAIRDGSESFEGIQSRISSNTSNKGDLIGLSSKIAGPGTKTGLDVQITNETDEDSFGVKLDMFNTGSNPTYGLFNVFTGTGTGTRYGIYSFNDDLNYLAGNLGIGILAEEAEDAKLNVAGDAKIRENVLIGTGSLNPEVMFEVNAKDDNLVNEGMLVRSLRNGNIGYTGVMSEVFGSGSGFKSGYRTSLSGNGSKTGLSITISGSGNSNYGVFSSGEDRNYFSGNVGIGTSVPTEKLHVNGSIRGNSIFLNDWEIKQDGLNVLSLSYEGVLKGVFLSTTGQYNMTSDRRLKKDIVPLGGVLAKVNKLKASQYQYKNNNPSSIKSIGFIAQDVQQIFPELVHSTSDANHQDVLTLDYSGFSVLAIKAIQEQNKIIDDQEERINALEKQVKLLLMKIENRQ